MYSFSAIIGSRGYHVYRQNEWTNISTNQVVNVCKETSANSIANDPYCCKITIQRKDRVGAVTVGHIPREISRFVYYFLQEGGSIYGSVVDTQPKVSPIPQGGLEVPLLLHFNHPKNSILERMKGFINIQVEKMKETFRFEEDDEECTSGRDEDSGKETEDEEEFNIRVDDERNDDDNNGVVTVIDGNDDIIAID